MNKTDLTTAFEQTSFLHGGNAQFIEQLKEIFVIDLAGAGLVAGGDVGDLDVGDRGDVLLHPLGHVALGDLHMVHVELQPDAVRADGVVLHRVGVADRGRRRGRHGGQRCPRRRGGLGGGEQRGQLTLCLACHGEVGQQQGVARAGRAGHSVAFAGGENAFMAEHWAEVATNNSLSKILVSLVVILPAYGLLLNYIQKHVVRDDDGNIVKSSN